MYTVKYGQKYDVSKPTVIFKLSLCCLIAWLLPRRPWEMKLNRLFFRLSMPAIKGTMSVRMACDSFKSLVHFYIVTHLKEMDETFWIYSIPISYFFLHFRFVKDGPTLSWFPFEPTDFGTPWIAKGFSPGPWKPVIILYTQKNHLKKVRREVVDPPGFLSCHWALLSSGSGLLSPSTEPAVFSKDSKRTGKGELKDS